VPPPVLVIGCAPEKRPRELQGVAGAVHVQIAGASQLNRVGDDGQLPWAFGVA
jgi:hypothetical protein